MATTTITKKVAMAKMLRVFTPLCYRTDVGKSFTTKLIVMDTGQPSPTKKWDRSLYTVTIKAIDFKYLTLFPNDIVLIVTYM